MKEKTYGLIGRVLKHSFSVPIHKALGCENYRLIELEPEMLEGFFENEDIGGLNVTIPYKKDVMKYCDEIDDAAKLVGSINTIVKVKGIDGKDTLKGYNTDVYGLSYAAKRAGIEIAGKKVLVFGSGGASLAAVSLCRMENAKECIVISRSGENNYDNLEKHFDADVLINATPLGMYPNTGEMAADPGVFKNLSGVIDMVYNPSRTAFLMRAEELSIPHVDGLPMLVAQAVRAEEIFTGREIPESETEKIIGEIRSETLNIVIIGMPGSGKSTISEELAKLTGRKLVDLDAEIVKSEGRSIEDIFAADGEEEFRRLERNAVATFGKESGLIISCGGGTIKDIRNYAPLHQNGRIYHIERSIELLARGGRPLSKDADLSKMYEERLPMYKKFRDKVIMNDRSKKEAAEEIWRDFNENTRY
ncbi:MAG: shikimate kinase [Firmicutes bacterium]|nr:shikimate kinase [Bacillota bacterium]